MVVLQEISSAIVNERNGTALLRHILDVLYRRMKMLRGTFTIRRGNDLMTVSYTHLTLPTIYSV